MNIYTVFCQDADGKGTIGIESVEAVSVEEAKEHGRKIFADSWNTDEKYIHVLGVAEGSVKILEWEDLE